MSAQLRRLRERLVTFFAFKRFLSRVSTEVGCEITLLNTLVVTSLKGTMKWFDPSMTTEVVDETTLL